MSDTHLEDKQAMSAHKKLISEIYADNDNAIEYLLVSSLENGEDATLQVASAGKPSTILALLVHMCDNIPVLLIDKIMDSHEFQTLPKFENNTDKKMFTIVHILESVLINDGFNSELVAAFGKSIHHAYKSTMGNTEMYNSLLTIKKAMDGDKSQDNTINQN